MALAAGLLGGCGFHPLYGSNGGTPASQAVSTKLSEVFVPVIPERTGMMMRQALQTRLERFGISPLEKFQLLAPIGINTEGVAIDPNSNVTRLRFTASTDWVLRSAGKGAIITSGSARALDAIDLTNAQFFAADLETQAAYQRMADTLADQVVAQLASYFATHPTTETTAN